METPFATATRLLAALEELIAEETTLIRTMDFVEAVEARERAAPLVDGLCALADDPSVLTLRPRLDALLERSGQNYHFLSNQLERLQAELTRVNEACGRMRRVAPVYKTVRSAAPHGESRLNTAA